MATTRPRSSTLIARAAKHIPGGVNSPVRAFRGVGGDPVFFASGEGAELVDVDGNRYVDYVGSWGPMIVGHNHPDVIAAVHAQVDRALGFGAPTEAEIELAEHVCERVPSIDMLRLVNSGTEATMSAIRVARGFTGRDRILKFEGCYHGHSDSLLVKAGSGLLTLGIPNSPGVPAAVAEQTLTAPFNDTQALADVFSTYGDELAAVILEPVPGNMGCVPPAPEFLETLRQLTQHHGALLIFDEVMTGFRVAHGGAQELYGIDADLTTLGKVIGGGLPVGAFGGRADVMARVAPLGDVYQAGTLSGNPLAVTAGLTTLKLMTRDVYAGLAAHTEQLTEALSARARAHNIAVTTTNVCGMFSLFFTSNTTIRGYGDVAACDIERFNRFFHLMLDRGVYLAPSAFETAFVSLAHDAATLERTVQAADAAFAALAS